MHESCGNVEILISRAMDGECTAEELTALKAHLAGCPDCRKTLRAFGEVDEILEKGGNIPPAPQCPRMPSSRPSLIWKRTFAFAAAACLVLVAFFGGAWWKERTTTRNFLPSYGRVASAALWEKASDPVFREAAFAALPLSEAVTGYQLEVARLLRQDQVDWPRVRRLVEAIGALRTDMEILTLHVAFIEREKGKPGSASAAWSDLLGLDGRGGSL
ncbi:MAG: zf-HC2 domain-containing protein [Synergistales bacterium]